MAIKSWLKKLSQWIPGDLKARPLPQSDNRITENKNAPQLDNEMLKQLINGIFITRPDELTCDECFEIVDQFSELVLAGKNAAAAMPLVQHHLDLCPGCREEFEALLDALRAVAI